MLGGLAGGGMLHVRRGAADLLRLKPSTKAIRERLRHYTLLQVLEALGRIDAVLRSETGDTVEAQVQLLCALFPPDTAKAVLRRVDLAQELDRLRDPEMPQGQPVFFEPAQLAALAVLAGSELPPEGPSTEKSLEPLGEALLMMNDLLGDVLDPSSSDIDTPEGALRWLHYFAVPAFGRGSNPVIHDVVRAVDLYLTPHEGLRDHPDYVDLPALFHEATHLSADAYMLALLAFVGRMYGVSRDNAASASAVVSYGAFGGNLSFTEE